MHASVEELKATLSGLSIRERAELVHYLLHSLEPPDEGAADEWGSLAETRMDDVRNGKVTGVPADQVWKPVEGTSE